MQEPARADLKALDARGRHRFGAQQDPRERFGVDQGLGPGVEHGDSCLGLGGIRHDRSGQHGPPASQRVGQVRLIFAGLAVFSGQPAAAQVWLPDLLHVLRHVPPPGS